MRFHMRCRDAGAECPLKFEAESKEQVMEEISNHLEESHPDLEVSRDQILELITTR